MYAKKPKPGITAIYARTARQNEQSLAWQVARCRAHCISRGWQPVTSYGDDGRPGTRLADRAELTRLLEDAAAGLIARVVVEDLERLARPPDLQVWLAKKFTSFGVSIHVAEDPRPSTAH